MYCYRSRHSYVCSNILLSLCTKSNGSESMDKSTWCGAMLMCFAKSLLLGAANEHGAKTSVKIIGPYHPPQATTPPLNPDLSFPHPLFACRRGPRPRVSICGQCTLLHEPRPFTEGPRNAAALNNHPPEDRRPCAPGRVQEAQENKAGIWIRQVAQQKEYFIRDKELKMNTLGIWLIMEISSLTLIYNLNIWLIITIILLIIIIIN